MTLDRTICEDYLARIGVEWPRRPDAETLASLQEQHILSIPFENVDCFRRRPLPMGEGAVRKIVQEGRGGGCYELNSAMGLLLESVGYPVTIMGGRISDGKGLSFPLRHLVLRVEADGVSWLVDVGFGFGSDRNSRRPLRIDHSAVQSDPQGDYQLVNTADGDIDVLRNERLLYRIERHPRSVGEFAATLWWFLTSPGSDFLQGMFCIQPTRSGRLSLRDRTLTRVVDGEKTRAELPDTDEVRKVLAAEFGIEVDDIPDLLAAPATIAPAMSEQVAGTFAATG